MDIYSWILTLAIISGQLLRVPILFQGGVTFLDFAVIILCTIGIFRIRFKLGKPPSFIKGALVFISVAVLSLFFTPLSLQPSEYLNAFLYTVRFGLYILLGWLIVSDGFPAFKNSILGIIIYSGVALAIGGLLQLLFLPDLRFLTINGWDPHFFRAASAFLDPNFLGAYFSLTLLTLSQFKSRKKLSILFFIIIYLGLLTTFSRGAYLAFLTGFMSVSILKRSIKMAFVSIVLFLGLLLGFSNYQTAVAAPRGINRTESAQFRFNTWQQGLTLFKSHPIFGVGFNAYRFALKEYNLADEQFLNSHGSSTNDSSLVYVAATTGTVGLVSFLLFLSLLMRQGFISFLKKNPWGGVLIGGVMATLVQSFFANTFFYPPILITIILLASLSKYPFSEDQKR